MGLGEGLQLEVHGPARRVAGGDWEQHCLQAVGWEQHCLQACTYASYQLYHCLQGMLLCRLGLALSPEMLMCRLEVGLSPGMLL